MLVVPRPDLLTFVHLQVVANDVNVRDRFGSLAIDLIQQSDEVLLALPIPANSDDRSRAGVERSEQLQSPFPLVFVFQPHRNVRRLCRERRSGTSARLQRGLFIHAKDPLTRPKFSRVELADLIRLTQKGLIPRNLGAQPVMNSPWLQTVGQKNPLDRLRRDEFDPLVPNKRASQLRARP